MEVNGKEYPLWGQFVEKQDEWVGGILEDSGDSFDRSLGIETMKTKITGIELVENGDDSAFFSVLGEDFDCGFDVHHGGISGGNIGTANDGWLSFSGYGGHTWRIRKPEKK